jgi:predicted enzyme related to lactoylglutathione lyase
MRPPFTFPVGTLAVVMDSQGAAFNLIQLHGPPGE